MEPKSFPTIETLEDDGAGPARQRSIVWEWCDRPGLEHLLLDLAACSDIDIMGTPFTNTMPIRRLVLPPEQPAALKVVYVAIPDLAISVAAQDYTRRDTEAMPTRFRYRSLGSDFTAELSVD